MPDFRKDHAPIEMPDHDPMAFDRIVA